MVGSNSGRSAESGPPHCSAARRVAHQVAVALLDHIAQMDADAELDAALGWSPALRSTMPFCTSTAQRTASATLLNSMRTPSPVRLTTRP